MTIDLRLALSLGAVLAAALVGARLATHVLGRRLDRFSSALAFVLPLALLLPHLETGRLMVPTGLLRSIPGTDLRVATEHDRVLNDAVFQFLPWEAEVRHAFAAGELPLWSDTLDGGSSPWSNPQTQVLSPLTWFARWVPLQHFLLAALAAKLVFGFVGAWNLAATIGLSVSTRRIAASSFALGGGMSAWALFPHTTALALVPWLAAAAIRLARAPSRSRLVSTAVATASLALSGHPEIALLGGGLVAATSLALARRRNFWRGLGTLALAAALGAMLSLPLLLPFWHTLRDSARYDEVGRQGFGEAQRRKAGFDGASIAVLKSPLHPAPYGRPYHDEFRGPFGWPDACSGYAGLAALCGTGILLGSRRRRFAAPLLGVAVIGLLVAARFGPFEDVLSRLPLLGWTAPLRFLPLAGLALAIAGAAGWERLHRSLPRTAGGAIRTLLPAGAAGAASLALGARPEVVGLWVLLGSAALLGWAGRRRLSCFALSATLAIDLLSFARDFLPFGDPEVLYPRTPFMESVRERVGDGGSRVVGVEYAVYPSLLSMYDLEDPRAHDPLASERRLQLLAACCGFRPTMQTYFDAFRHAEHPFVDFLGVRHAIGGPWDPPIPGWIRLPEHDERGTVLWENPDALPRWFLPSAVEIVEDSELAARVQRMTDARAVFLVRSTVPGDFETSTPLARGSVTERSRDRGRIRLEVALDRPGLVVSSIPGPEGWRAEGPDGKLPTVAVHDAFLGFVAPPGTTAVSVRYRPPGLIAGCWAALAAAVLLVALTLSRTSWSRRRALASSPR